MPISLRPDGVVEIAADPLVGSDVLAAIGRGQSCPLLGDQKSRGVAFTFDVESHHVHQLIVDLVWLIIRDGGQGPALVECA
jgi:hypothetical protein